MSIWLVRAGTNGQYEEKFLNDNKIYLTWDSLNHDLNSINSKESLSTILSELYNLEKPKTISNWLSQIWAFSKRIQKDDWIVLPSKLTRTINI